MTARDLIDAHPGRPAPAYAARFLHPSNLITYGSLLAGMAAVAAAHQMKSASLAGALLALGVIADTFDGRFARRFRRDALERRFGEHLDSLTDAITFGLVPVLVVVLLLPPMSDTARLGWWAAGFVYVASVITRLGFYNVVHEDLPGFIGLPAPVSALVLSSLLLAPVGPTVLGAVLVGCAVLMLSPLRIARPRGLGLAAFAAWGLAVAILHGLAWLGR